MIQEELKYFFALTHFSAAVLFDTAWEEAHSAELLALASRAMKYRYSSIGEYVAGKFIIASPEHFPDDVRRSKKIETLLKFWTKLRREADAKL